MATSRDGRTEVHARNSRKVFKINLAVGCIGLVLAIFFETFRSPYAIVVFVAAFLLGAAGIFDRRLKLTLLDVGVRYAQWGSVFVPWQEFSGYRWATWRNSPYLQLVPRQPTRTLNSFSLAGKLNQRLARIIGVSAFGVAVTPLDVSRSELEECVSRYLQKHP